MAQATVGKDSSPLARANDPVSIFKTPDAKRPAKKQQAEEQPTVTTEQTPPTVTPLEDPRTRLEYLKAEQKRIAAEAKALQASLPKMSALDRVIEQQTAHCADPLLKGKVIGRIKAGQGRAEAIEAVIALTREWLEANIPE